MTEQKRRLVMDVVAPSPQPEPYTTKRKAGWSWLRRLQGLNPVRRSFLAICAAAVVIALACGIFLYTHRATCTLPAAVTGKVNFPLYYPTPLPLGFVLKKGSASANDGIVFYILQSKARSITVSEQALPPSPPDLNHLSGFSPVQTSAGRTFISTTSGRPVAVILSNTTLITITGSQNMPSDVIGSLAKSMASLPQ